MSEEKEDVNWSAIKKASLFKESLEVKDEEATPENKEKSESLFWREERNDKRQEMAISQSEARRQPRLSTGQLSAYTELINDNNSRGL